MSLNQNRYFFPYLEMEVEELFKKWMTLMCMFVSWHLLKNFPTLKSCMKSILKRQSSFIISSWMSCEETWGLPLSLER